MLRIGVIGTGSIAAVHLDGWRQMPGIELVGYYDILPEAAERGGETWRPRFRQHGRPLRRRRPGRHLLARHGAIRRTCWPPRRAGHHLRENRWRHPGDAVEMVETCRRRRAALPGAGRASSPCTAVKDAIDSGAIGAPGVFRSALAAFRGRDATSAPHYADFNQSGGVVPDVAARYRLCAPVLRRCRARLCAGSPLPAGNTQDHALITPFHLRRHRPSRRVGQHPARQTSASHRGGGATAVPVEWDSLTGPLVAEYLRRRAGLPSPGSSPSSVTDEPYYAELAHFVAITSARRAGDGARRLEAVCAAGQPSSPCARAGPSPCRTLRVMPRQIKPIRIGFLGIATRTRPPMSAACAMPGVEVAGIRRQRSACGRVVGALCRATLCRRRRSAGRRAGCRRRL